jgi:hypothetical protein
MRFFRWKETRLTASLVAVIAWALGLMMSVNISRTIANTMPLLVLMAIGALPVLVMLSPALLAYIALRAGRFPAVVCLAAGISACGAAAGASAAFMAALLLLPPLVFSVYSYERKLPFWQSAAGCAGMQLGAGIVILWMLNAMNGGDMVTALRAALDSLTRSVPAPETDALLKMLASVGFVRFPDTVLPAVQSGTVALDVPVRNEMIKQFLFTTESLLRQSMPGQILQGAIYGGVLSVAWPRRVASRYATVMELAPFPPFHEWHIPARFFKFAMYTLLGAGLLMFLSGEQALISLVNVLWAGLTAAAALQGGALLAFMMRKGGLRASLRIAVTVAALCLLNYVLVLLGFADQLFNSRMLRKPPDNPMNDAHDEE